MQILLDITLNTPKLTTVDFKLEVLFMISLAPVFREIGGVNNAVSTYVRLGRSSVPTEAMCSNLGIAGEGDKSVCNIGIFGGFLAVFLFSQILLTNFLHFSIPPLHVILYPCDSYVTSAPLCIFPFSLLFLALSYLTFHTY